MKHIVLITKQYPYSDREQFLDPELSYCSEMGIKVDIVSAFVSKKETACRSIPDGIKSVKRFDASDMNLNTLLCMIKAFISPYKFHELKSLKDEGVYNRSKAKRAFKFLVKAIRIATQVENIFKEELQRSPENIILYSYWMEEAACAAVLLKNKYGCKAVSRIHGYDLYVERHKESYIPYHKWMVSELSMVCPVSELGKNYLLNKYRIQGNVVTQNLATVDCGITPELNDKFTIFF